MGRSGSVSLGTRGRSATSDPKVQVMDEVSVTRQTYDKIAQRYAERWATNDAVVEEARRRFLAHLPPNPSVVDIGCGPGRDLQALAKDGIEAVGVDLSLAMLAEARKRFSGVYWPPT